MENGWIKIHNKLLKWEWSSDPNMVSVWIHLLLMANWQDRNWQGINIKRGQLVTGRKTLSTITGVSEQTLRTCMERLKETGEITIQSTNKYSIITIVKWSDYQNCSKNQPTTNQQSTSNQPAINQVINQQKSVKKSTNKTSKKNTTQKINQQGNRSKILKTQKSTTPKDIRYKINTIADVPSAPWILEEKLQDMEKKEGSYLDFIASFIREKPVKIENSKQLSVVITRYCRVAKQLEGAYTSKQVFDAIDAVKKDNERRRIDDKVDWTLDTVLKKLTK
jgi:hypothetical protein